MCIAHVYCPRVLPTCTAHVYCPCTFVFVPDDLSKYYPMYQILNRLLPYLSSSGVMANKTTVFLFHFAVFGHLFSFSSQLQPQFLSFFFYCFSSCCLWATFRFPSSVHLSGSLLSFFVVSYQIPHSCPDFYVDLLTLVLIRIFLFVTTFDHITFSIFLKHFNRKMPSLWLSL